MAVLRQNNYSMELKILQKFENPSPAELLLRIQSLFGNEEVKVTNVKKLLASSLKKDRSHLIKLQEKIDFRRQQIESGPYVKDTDVLKCLALLTALEKNKGHLKKEKIL
jgi:hypothetical protein